ncbi:MAG: lactobin A/cerein 7B family class IIb bacteriocin [Bacteroidales bacterium]|nr:lactobin A/cerein 7B family class IIb bacteriocin [Bacteroidales bacterium]
MGKKQNYLQDELQILDSASMCSVSGGWIATAIALIGAGIYIYNNAGDFISGFKAAVKYE